MVDLMGVGQSFGFKLSKEFQLGNTKVYFLLDFRLILWCLR